MSVVKQASFFDGYKVILRAYFKIQTSFVDRCNACLDKCFLVPRIVIKVRYYGLFLA